MGSAQGGQRDEDHIQFAPQVPMGRPVSGKAMSGAERKRNARRRRAQGKVENIAVLDFETDPFDNEHPDRIIAPFLAVLIQR